MREAEMADLKKQAEDLKVRSATSPISIRSRTRRRRSRRAFEMPEVGEVITEKPSEPAALPEPQQQVDVKVPLPDPPSLVSEKDFAAAEAPPPKQAGGGA